MSEYSFILFHLPINTLGVVHPNNVVPKKLHLIMNSYGRELYQTITHTINVLVLCYLIYYYNISLCKDFLVNIKFVFLLYFTNTRNTSLSRLCCVLIWYNIYTVSRNNMVSLGNVWLTVSESKRDYIPWASSHRRVEWITWDISYVYLLIIHTRR